ncbi:hypothetical protein JCM11641_003885 [Rhodosporidiobolus odoratus]
MAQPLFGIVIVTFPAPSSLLALRSWPAVLAHRSDTSLLLKVLMKDRGFTKRCRREMSACGWEEGNRNAEWEMTSICIEDTEDRPAPPVSRYLTVPLPGYEKPPPSSSRYQINLTFRVPKVPRLRIPPAPDITIQRGVGLPSIVITDFDGIPSPPPSPPFEPSKSSTQPRQAMSTPPFVRV